MMSRACGRCDPITVTGVADTARHADASADAATSYAIDEAATRTERLTVWGEGGLRPGVDLDDTAALLDLMEAPDDEGSPAAAAR